ncbi:MULTISPECIES: LLM class flavin-dependent oxidoreductase [Ramlibacter]|uniref:LLM class flavin-dependent oxidoreductase n=1 Tax=Ramlibacter pinisoli TaxID=2682844 RepID=A0A6N8IXG7_9BURK|nr:MULTISPECIES: LLM class flavin-dependent oxidoreductase [Ramlibacter]MBA2961767.1 LLM class flavin-dependent oxidoreductase [Ramlibacter sp. CGMCC 1.13660]MVQ31709.1 LLM class flavin-dependent oxidoreductase [Ramlibacter pinisoli]
MQSWYFSEQSYAPAWDEPVSPKVTSPSRLVNPETAHRLLREYIAECKLADELGMNIMTNEHHATYTCMSVSSLMTLAVLATHTRHARLLALGVPIMNRMDPYRVAEEAAYVDVLSRGRLELGLIKGSTFELYMSNSNPVTSGARYWEAHDLIVAALAKKDGPISYESDNYNYRYLNVIPGCYQQPTPPIWMTTLSPFTAREAAQRGYVIAITAVARAARACFPAYREEYQRVHGRPAPLDRLCYLGQVVVARDEGTALERARKLLRFNETSERIDARFINPPGMMPPAENARLLKAGTTTTHRNKTLPDGTPMSDPPTPREQIINHVLFAGTPDQVYDQIKTFYDSVGGFGNLLVQLGGPMSHEEICDSLTLYATEVMPRLQELTRSHEAAVA